MTTSPNRSVVSTRIGRTPSTLDRVIDEVWDWLEDHTHRSTQPYTYAGVAHAVREALADRTFVELPEPTSGTTEQHTPLVTFAHWEVGDFRASAVNGPSGPKVNVFGGPYLDPDVAEARALALLAAARAALDAAGDRG